MVGEAIRGALRDSESRRPGRGRAPAVPNRARPVEVDSQRRFPRLLRRQQNVRRGRPAARSRQLRGAGEIVVRGPASRLRRRALAFADAHLNGGGGAGAVPRAGREVQAEGLRLGLRLEAQGDPLLFTGAELAEGHPRAGFAGQRSPEPVLACCPAGVRHEELDHLASVRIPRRPAIHAQQCARRHIAVHRQREIDVERAVRRRLDQRLGRGDGELRRGRPADHRPSDAGPRGRAVDPTGHGLQTVGAGRRIGEDHPLHIVHYGARRAIAAGALVGRAGHAAVDPQVQVVEHGRTDRFRGRLVPRHHHVKAFGARRHHNVLVGERVGCHLGLGGAADPAVFGVAAEHARARRRLAEAVDVLQRARAIAVVQSKSAAPSEKKPRQVAALEKSVRLDRARHQQRLHRGGSLAQRRHRVHDQRRHARDRRCRHARAVVDDVLPFAAASPGGGDGDAGPHHVGKEPAVGCGAAAAEGGHPAIVFHRAHREDVLGGGVVHIAPRTLVAGGDRVELPGSPDHRVEFSFDGGARFPAGGANA